MITIIAAVSKDGFIARHEKIPWRLKSDIDLFRNLTTGHTVIMGRTTWRSLPKQFRPLPDRTNIVLSRNPSFRVTGATVCGSLEQALALTENESEVFIMGGAEVYRAALPLAERMILTHVDMTVGDGDVRFPTILDGTWNRVSCTDPIQNEDDVAPFTVEDLSPNLPFIELANVRTFEQLKVMRQIRQRKHCPFCPENLATYHHRPILKEGEYWLLTENQWPYPDTESHFLLISKTHVENVKALSPWAQGELFSMIADLEWRGSFPGGGIGMRSGDPILSGASVRHLHAQIVSPKRGGNPALFYIGSSRKVTP